MQNGVLVAGAGHAAGEFAIRLRQSGYTAPIRLIGDEQHLPYNRPPLSKAFLAGNVAADGLLLRSQAAYDRSSVTITLNSRVQQIDRAARTVTLHTGEVAGYDHLVLATGGRARRLTCPGADLAGIVTLRGIDDVEAMRQHIRPGRRLVIVGGGYVGLEVASVAVKMGLDVTVLEAAPRLLARVAGPEISAFYEAQHRAAGVHVHTGAQVSALVEHPERSGHVGGAVLADGTTIEADFVLAGIGQLPNVELAAAAGLSVENGIVVDEYCRTEDHQVLAIGDCSNHPSPYAGGRLRLESVPNAVEQAKVAADTILGNLVPYDAVPWFWSDQYDLKLQAVGLSAGHDQVVIRGLPSERAFTVLYLRQGVLIASDSVNRPADFMMARKLVGVADLDLEHLRDAGRPLKGLVERKKEAVLF